MHLATVTYRHTEEERERGEHLANRHTYRGKERASMRVCEVSTRVFGMMYMIVFKPSGRNTCNRL